MINKMETSTKSLLKESIVNEIAAKLKFKMSRKATKGKEVFTKRNISPWII
jgi:hypothetical protein